MQGVAQRMEQVVESTGGLTSVQKPNALNQADVADSRYVDTVQLCAKTLFSLKNSDGANFGNERSLAGGPYEKRRYCRLPTELEWLGFAVVEDGICETLDDVLQKEQVQKSLGIESGGSDWTSTQEGDKNVVRTGPWIRQCRVDDSWRQLGSRSAQPRDMSHAGLTFRTVSID